MDGSMALTAWATIEPCCDTMVYAAREYIASLPDWVAWLCLAMKLWAGWLRTRVAPKALVVPPSPRHLDGN